MNHDGYADYAVAARQASDDSHGLAAGQVRVYSGIEGVLLHTWSGPSAGDQLGSSVAAAGDPRAVVPGRSRDVSLGSARRLGLTLLLRSTAPTPEAPAVTCQQTQGGPLAFGWGLPIWKKRAVEAVA